MDWHKGKSALWSDVSKVLEITAVVSLHLKRKRIIQIVNCAKFKIQHLWWYGDVLARTASWVTRTSVKKPLRLKVSYRFGTTCSLSRPCIFQGHLCLFLQDSEVTFCWLTTAWLQNKRVQVLDGPVCSPDQSPMEYVWKITKRLVEQLKLYIKQE